MMVARFCAVLALGAGVALPQAAQAQALRTWVSALGDDAAACSRAAPCRSLAGAFAKTAAGGEIDVLDTGSFGAVVITRAVTVRATGVTAAVQATSGAAITVAAGAGDLVVLDGLALEGVGSGSAGVQVVSGSNVVVMRSTITRFASGVDIGGGLAMRVTVEECRLAGNGVGVAVGANVGAGAAGMGKAKLLFNIMVGNAEAGIRVNGAGNDALLSGNQVLGSAKALDLQNGGSATSFGDNVLTSGDQPVLVAKG